MNSLAIFGAQYLVFIIALIGFIYFLNQPRDKQKSMVIFACITLPITYLISFIASHLYYNPRPFISEHIVPLITHKDNNGFPSDHTLLSAAIAVIILYANRTWGLILFALAVIVGVSRVYVGVHHLVDIIASLVIAILGGCLAWFFRSRLQNKPSSSIMPPINQ